MRDDFAIFILTHKRPHNQKTKTALRNSGYSGKIYLVLDDEDTSIQEYANVDNSDAEIFVFNKEQYVKSTDTGLINPNRNFAVFARNAIEDIAVQLDYKYFGMFDDDIIRFRHRVEVDGHLCSFGVTNMDEVISAHLDYMYQTNLACMSFGILTNFMGGIEGMTLDSSKYRLCFNSYLRDASRKVCWGLNMWEDVITSVLSNKYGQVWLQSPFIQMDCSTIGADGSANEGGNTEAYRNTNLLNQQFFTVMACPDCFTIWKDVNKQLPRSKYNVMCNKIISGGYKK